MAAPVGNKFWKARAKHGKDKMFADPLLLWEVCCDYFQWVEENPLIEMRPFAYQGVVIQEPVPKMRAMTQSGLCLFLGVSEQMWRDYRQYKDFVEVTTRVDSIIYEHKFTGAAADLLNPNIIARDLGLSDKQQVDNTHKLEGLSDLELENRIKALENDLNGEG